MSIYDLFMLWSILGIVEPCNTHNTLLLEKRIEYVATEDLTMKTDQFRCYEV